MDTWELGALNIYDISKKGPLEAYFNFIKANHNLLDGDVFEFGVFKGKSLLATALLLKELGSSKVVYGFDSFSGFPEYSPQDNIDTFNLLYKEGVIDEAHYSKVKRNIEIRNLYLKNNLKVDASNVSNSGKFDDCDVDLLERKIRFLGLDNIKLVKGPFVNTLDLNKFSDKNAMCCLVDCDLYSSYKQVLPFAWTKLVKSGMIYYDEYFSLKFPGARIAVDEFMNQQGCTVQTTVTEFDTSFFRCFTIK